MFLWALTEGFFLSCLYGRSQETGAQCPLSDFLSCLYGRSLALDPLHGFLNFLSCLYGRSP